MTELIKSGEVARRLNISIGTLKTWGKNGYGPPRLRCDAGYHVRRVLEKSVKVLDVIEGTAGIAVAGLCPDESLAEWLFARVERNRVVDTELTVAVLRALCNAAQGNRPRRR